MPDELTYNSAHTVQEIDAAVQKYKDGNIYEVQNAQIYSTEETIIGTWVDGKPLYRRCIVTITGASGEITSIPIDDSMAETVVSIRAIIQKQTVNNVNHAVFTPDGYYQTSGDNFMCWGDAANVHIKNTYAGRGDKPVIIVIEYTKSTDTATIAIPDATAMLAAYEEGVQSA